MTLHKKNSFKSKASGVEFFFHKKVPTYYEVFVCIMYEFYDILAPLLVAAALKLLAFQVLLVELAFVGRDLIGF